MKRAFDFFCLILLILISTIMLLTAIGIRLISKGSSLYWSLRVGRCGILFKMPKFRSMLIETPDIATHLLNTPDT